MISRVVNSICALLLAFIVLFPPYFAMDTGSAGQVHASIGRYPVWASPTPAEGLAALREHVSGGIGELDPASVVVSLNVVSLVTSFLMLALVWGSVRLILARRTR